MIPHVIHYCWFGNNPKPKLIKDCIESWKKYCQGWEIREWNEDNYDVYKNEYIKGAYESKKWAFVADYARFDVLNQHGGVYFDTDVELLKPIPDYLMEEEAFSGFELEDKVNPGLVYGTISNQKVLGKVLKRYEESSFGQISNVVELLSEILVEEGLKGNNTDQTVGGVRILPTEYFGCYNHEIQNFEKTENTISIHHYYASWIPWYRIFKYKVVIRYTAALLGKDRYLRIKHAIKRKK